MSPLPDNRQRRMRKLYRLAAKRRYEVPLVPGDVIGKCRIERELGRGGMATVFLAEHTTLAVPVAVKVLPPTLAAEDPDFERRFLREARLAAQLRHPNVVGILDADRDEGSGLCYIIQEFVDAGSLLDLLQNGPVDIGRSLRIADQIASALEAAALAGIVHRDIKPENILLSREGDAKLADLGLAASTREGASRFTRSRTTMGTAAYMSPEQLKDARLADARSDIYSLGATLFHLLTGQSPFAGKELLETLDQVQNGPTPDPEAVKADLPIPIVELCRKMMARSPQDRFQSAEALRTALGFLDSGP